MQLGVPSVAFSGSASSIAQEPWTALTSSPTAPSVLAAETYAALTVRFLAALFTQPAASPSLLPGGVTINVNFPAVEEACGADDVQWVLARTFPVLFGNPDDVVVCGNGGRLPQDYTVVRGAGCFASVSVISATTKRDADKTLQADVLARLGGLGFVCYDG